MKTIILSASIIMMMLGAASLLAQESPAASALNAVYAEAYGPGGAFSVNYDRLVAPYLFLRAGGSYVPYDWYGLWDAALILYGGAFRLSSSPGTWELGGAGISMLELTRLSGASRRMHHGWNFLFGYRYQPAVEGLVFRATSSMVVLPNLDSGQPGSLGIYLSVGLSLGYGF